MPSCWGNPVSYTHLDVYKRQRQGSVEVLYVTKSNDDSLGLLRLSDNRKLADFDLSPLALSLIHISFGLAVIWGCARLRSVAAPFAVGAYSTGAYWFTASTSFANPAVMLARSASGAFAGIRPADAPVLILAQPAAAATLSFRWLAPPEGGKR